MSPTATYAYPYADNWSEESLQAASHGFCNFGSETKTPILGHVVVFQNIDNKENGHIALFLGDTPISAHILGGNQGKGGEKIPSYPPAYPVTEIGRERRDKEKEYQRGVSNR